MTTSTLNSLNSDLRQSEAQVQLNAAYRQVFGNAHLFEDERSLTAESLFVNGDLTVQGLINALALSDTYRRLFFDANGPYRFIELNFKHLLGRAPRNQAELSEHVQILAQDGYEAEINSYLYSAEYLEVFGFDTVPYDQGTVSQCGESNVTYNRTRALASGFAGFDGDRQPQLLFSLATGSTPRAAQKTPGPGGHDSQRYVIRWTTTNPVGLNRRVTMTTTAPFSSLSGAIQSIHRRGGRIASVTES
ncbi:MAG: phycobilisome rod-core linker polypeptide [Prochlorococcaceae cyanobacterium]